MKAYDVIKKKRNKYELEPDEIFDFVSGYVAGDVKDYQMSALLMAVFLNGMSNKETVALTNALARSGEMFDLSAFGKSTVDKHSTGGVGDKTTLIVAPIAAALGCTVAKMSGRGLGFTGGTYDKLASIPGYRITPGNSEFLSIVKRTGISVVGQSEHLAPADNKIYALRDVTATVESLPLIASSIMSKKLAAGAHNIVLDVKYGAGAFMKTPESAEELANIMVNIGREQGRNTVAVISDMNTPLGYAVGNNLEVAEAVRLLRGEHIPDLYSECITVSALMVSTAKNIPFDEAKTMCDGVLKNGTAYNKFKEWILAQGGDISYIENTEKFPKCKYEVEVCAGTDGFINNMDTEKIGEIACMLGAGRKTVEDTVDFSAGILLAKKTGDYVKCGDPLCTLYTNDASSVGPAESLYGDSVIISSNKPETAPQILKIIS